MTLALPDDLLLALQPLTQALPPDVAMTQLVAAQPGSDAHLAIVRDLIQQHAWQTRSALAAGLYLYVDQLDLSHRLSQRMEDDPTGCYWHAIMHRREGDFSNSLYWLRRVGKHDVMATVGEGYDAAGLVRQVESAVGSGAAPAALVNLQRREWVALMAWCWVNGR